MFKKLTLLTLILFSFAITTNAQLPLSIDIYGGVAGSAFEDQESSGTGVVVGGGLLIDIIPIIDAGAEFNTLVSPFSFEESAEGITAKADVSLTYYGLFGTFDILPLVAVTGYIRAGVGMYSGTIKIKEPMEFDVDLKSSVGFNAGVGIRTMIGLYGEFRYNFVNMEEDFEGAASSGYNNWMLVAGYRFGL